MNLKMMEAIPDLFFSKLIDSNAAIQLLPLNQNGTSNFIREISIGTDIGVIDNILKTPI